MIEVVVMVVVMVVLLLMVVVVVMVMVAHANKSALSQFTKHGPRCAPTLRTL